MSAANGQLIVREIAGISRHGEIVRLGVSCPRAEFPPNEQFGIFDARGQKTPCQSRVLKRWPDGSPKWLLLDFRASVESGKSVAYTLRSGINAAVITDSVRVLSGDDVWRVDTGKATFFIDARVFRPFSAVCIGGEDVLRHSSSFCRIELQDQKQIYASIDKIVLEDAGPLRVVVRMEGSFTGKTRFFCRLYFQAASSAAKIEFTLRNTSAAYHPNGLWDLGDEASLLFRGLSFSFPSNATAGETYCVPEHSRSPVTVSANSSLSIYQESSGGENWRSPVHRNREGQVPMRRCGYALESDGKEVLSGLRATPLVWCGQGREGMALAAPYFWQKFPGEIVVRDGTLSFLPFPTNFPDMHELQGGEQSTCEFWIDFATEKEGLLWALSPLVAHASPDFYRESGVFCDLPENSDLIDNFITTADLLLKRETVDEYGWRNFGEIYADHEAVFHKGKASFVSHYNNQYDFIAGLYRTFFATGDPAWQELAADLSLHVLDIDLYHTDDDREEYNHGLFWHTDHYIDAGLSTHRSFSREHLQTKDPRFCGGGPGAEHCYTTGLMLHYFQTGNSDFRQAVLNLADWELTSLSGPQTILAVLKRGLGYFSLWRASLGEKKLFPRYPLTRGTGNAITACLDAFEVGGDRKFLEHAERLIKGAMHSDDDIACRELLNAETAWSYTVLLAAVGKFLDKKVELDEMDSGFVYARASFLAYAVWMLTNEYPYLDKPEILEYPNETWTAQDLRKSVVFYKAACYADSSQMQMDFLAKARFFYEYAAKELSRHPSSKYSRPVALMLQNGWVGDYLKSYSSRLLPKDCAKKLNQKKNDPDISGSPVPYLGVVSIIKRIATELASALGKTNIRRELAWLRARL